MIYLWAWWTDDKGKHYLRGPYNSLVEMDTAVSRVHTGRYEQHESTHRDPQRVKAEIRETIAQQSGVITRGRFYKGERRVVA